MEFRVFTLRVGIVAALAVLLLPRPLVSQDDCPLESNVYTEEAARKIEQAQKATQPGIVVRYYQEAWESVEQVFRLRDNDLTGLWLAGLVQVGLGDYVAADSFLTRLEQADARCQGQAEQTRYNAWVTLYNEAVHSIRDGDDASALATLELANDLYKDARSLNHLGRIYQDRGENAKAIEAYRAVAGLAADQATQRSATVHLAELLAAEGRQEDALAVYTEYTAENPGDVLIQAHYAEMLSKIGQPDSAQAVFVSLMAREDLGFAEWTEIGVGLFRTGAVPEAIAAFESALRLEPLNKTARVNLLDAHMEARDYASASLLADSLVQWYPYEPENYKTLAICYSSTGRAKDAYSLLALQDTLPFEFEAVGLHSMGDDAYVVQGMVTGGRAVAGDTVEVPFDFLDRNGEVADSRRLQLTVPARGVRQAFRLTVESEVPIAGFRYRRAGGS